MKMNFTKKLSSFILCTALIVAMAFTTAGCNGRSDNAASSKDDAGTKTTQTGDSTPADTSVSDKDAGDADASGKNVSQTDTSVSYSDESSSQNHTNTSGENESADGGSASDKNGSQTDNASSDKNASGDDAKVLGEGSTQFMFTVTAPDNSETKFEIHTDKETVGEALSDLGLIEGEEGQYGLYVTTVNGITADYDKDGLYWAFYIDDEYAQSGVDSVSIQEGSVYSFKAEKA